MTPHFGIPVVSPGGPYAGADIHTAAAVGSIRMLKRELSHVLGTKAYYLLRDPAGFSTPRPATLPQILLEIQAVGQMTFSEIAVEVGCSVGTIREWKNGHRQPITSVRGIKLVRIMREKQFMNHFFKLTDPVQLKAVYARALAMLGLPYSSADTLSAYTRYKEACKKRGGDGIELPAAAAMLFDVSPALSRRLQVFSFTETMICFSVRQDMHLREVINPPHKTIPNLRQNLTKKQRADIAPAD
jgi:hypothetical protein